jgi:peptidoglycan L-alanyl-D-glutamate endopeptidase CwlK
MQRMSDPTKVDRDPAHLFPEFRKRLAAAQKAAKALTGRDWVLVEGYRSQARQDFLYAQGRTRPGPIVTWMKSPKWHGKGLAADLAPLQNGKAWYDAPRELWKLMQDCAREHGLINPAWANGDLGHLQMAADAATIRAAAAFVKGGFK